MGRLGIHFGFQLSTTVPQMLKEGYYLDSCLQEKIKETRSRLRRRCGLNWAVLCETIEGKQPQIERMLLQPALEHGFNLHGSTYTQVSNKYIESTTEVSSLYLEVSIFFILA